MRSVIGGFLELWCVPSHSDVEMFPHCQYSAPDSLQLDLAIIQLLPLQQRRENISF